MTPAMTTDTPTRSAADTTSAADVAISRMKAAAELADALALNMSARTRSDASLNRSITLIIDTWGQDAFDRAVKALEVLR